MHQVQRIEKFQWQKGQRMRVLMVVQRRDHQPLFALTSKQLGCMITMLPFDGSMLANKFCEVMMISSP
jgi:hypothetical protein